MSAAASDVVGDDERDCRRDLEVLRAAPRARACEALGERVGVEVLVFGGEEQGQPAVAELGAERDVLGPLGAEVDRDVLRSGWIELFSGLPSPVPSGSGSG